MDPAIISIIIMFALILVFVAVLFSFIPVGLWISAWAAGVRIGIFTLVGMRFRRYRLP